jgi:GTPase SAR1 family protein
MFKFTKDYFSVLADSPIIDKLLVVVGLTGVGKSKLIERLMQMYPDKFAFSKTVTTDTSENPHSNVIVPKDKFIEVSIIFI